MKLLLYVFMQLVLVLLLAPLVDGIIKKIKAFSQKRKGPPLTQMYFDLYKLMKKDTVVSETASWVFRTAPYITFISTLLAFMFFPATVILHSISFQGDIILAIYLLGIGRFFMVLAGLDTGSTFGGMGSSREVMIAALIEPALIVVLITLGLIAGSTSIYDIMLLNLQGNSFILNPYSILLFAAIFLILLAETARIPVDDPSTHLELTMIHEAMLLEYSGKHLALMELASVIKQLLFITILANFFLPTGWLGSQATPMLSFLLALITYFFKVVCIALLIAIAEISTVKLRFFSVPNLAAISFALAFLGFMQFIILGR
ncbi:MAG: formate hydrogenlyase [Firmicutes bacterium HGW-Firmicutes-12]|jgi:formate hydrogenlyase subunit 4|nr:MAG: formate hydrogenlyase [Firmicutes bacterium HGW-Firmicutes-12]